jgi:hypothetical protein
MKTVRTTALTALKQRATRFGIGLGLAATLALGAVMPALAADPGVTVTNGTLSQGTLTVTNDTGNKGPILRNGTVQSRTTTVAVPVSDYRTDSAGWTTSAGWKTTFQLADFVDGTTSMGATTVDISTVSATCTVPSTGLCSDDPTLANGATPTSVTPGGTAGADTNKVFSAAIGHGNGEYGFTPTLTIHVPATAKNGTYSSMLTVSTVTGP